MTKEISLKDGSIALVDDEDYEALARYSWRSINGYAARSTTVNCKKVTIYMHRAVTNCPVNLEPDHDNHNTLDNRKENLVLGTHARNMRNLRRRSSNSSGYTGVSFEKKSGRWRVDVGSHGNSFVGLFDTPEEAALAYNKRAEELGYLTRNVLSNVQTR